VPSVARPTGGVLLYDGLLRFSPLFVLLFLILGTSFSAASGAHSEGGNGILGGPEEELASPQSDVAGDLATLEAVSPIFFNEGAVGSTAAEDENIAGFVFLDNAAISNTGSLLGGILTQRDGLMIYKVQKGDTVSGIAANFGISMNTVLWANAAIRSGSLPQDREITILPVSGVLYEAKAGDTVSAVASSFGVDPERIRIVNRLPGVNDLEVGKNIVVPDGKPKKASGPASDDGVSLPSLAGYFAFPAQKNSWNWGRLHAQNAVDIANACGSPIYAAADGLVSDVGNPTSWNGGYGGFVKIEHPNGAVTIYAHTSQNSAVPGSFVEKGDAIAKIGRTGNVHGPTGCHLHFEVHGAKNPFVK